MSIVNTVYEQIKKGMSGENQGMPMGLPKLEGLVDGVSKSTYTLLAGGTGSGKTTFALYAYIYRPFMDNIDNPNFHVIYYSMEMPATSLFIKLLSMYVWETFHRQLTYKEILSRKRGFLLPEDDYALLEQCRGWLEKLEKVITIYDRSLNADKMYAHLLGELEKHGRFERTETRKFYIPNNKDQVLLVVIDHIGLLRPTKGRSIKEEIDMASSYLVTLRNICGISPLVLMQINRGSSSMERRQGGLCEIKLQDIKNTGNPSEDCDIAIAVFHPHREQLATYRDYKIRGCLEDTFRAILVLKGRYDCADVSIGNCFYGSVGIWKELPKGKEITDYTPYLTLDGNGDMKTHGDVTFEIKMD